MSAALAAREARKAAGLPPAREILLKDLQRGRPLLISEWATKANVSQPTAHAALNRLKEQGHNIVKVVEDGKPLYQLVEKRSPGRPRGTATKRTAKRTATRRTAAKRTATKRASTPRAATRRSPVAGGRRTRKATIAPELFNLPAIDDTLTVCGIVRTADGELQVNLRNGSAIFEARITGQQALV